MARAPFSRTLGWLLNAHRSAKFEYECLEYAFLGYRRTQIADAKPGEVIRGVGRLRAEGPPLIAPLTGGRCVWYRTVVQPWEGGYGRRSQINMQRSVSMFVDDETGSARLNMMAAQVSLEDMRQDWSYEPPFAPDTPGPATTESVRRFMAANGLRLRYRRRGILERMFSGADWPESRAARYREYVLRERDRVALLGEVVQEPDPTARAGGGRQLALRMVFGELPSGVIVSNESGACA